MVLLSRIRATGVTCRACRRGQLPSPWTASLQAGSPAAAGREGRAWWAPASGIRGEGSRAWSFQGRLTKGAREETRDNARRNSRVPEPSLCPQLSHVQPCWHFPASVCVTVSSQGRGATRWRVGTPSPSQQCPPGPGPHQSSVGVNPFRSPTGLCGEMSGRNPKSREHRGCWRKAAVSRPSNSRLQILLRRSVPAAWVKPVTC